MMDLLKVGVFLFIVCALFMVWIEAVRYIYRYDPDEYRKQVLEDLARELDEENQRSRQ